MPVYEYKCSRCNHQREKVRKIANRHKHLACLKCHSLMELQISLTADCSWKPLELELETNKPKVYTSKRKLKEDCERLGKSMPQHDIN